MNPNPNPAPTPSRGANPRVLLIVASDPRTSHRPAEGIRMMAGVGAWKKADVTVYLRGPAILALGEWVDELVQDDDFTRYLPILSDSKRPIYVESGSPFLNDLGDSAHRFEPLDDSGLARVMAEQQYVLRF